MLVSQLCLSQPDTNVAINGFFFVSPFSVIISPHNPLNVNEIELFHSYLICNAVLSNNRKYVMDGGSEKNNICCEFFGMILCLGKRRIIYLVIILNVLEMLTIPGGKGEPGRSSMPNLFSISVFKNTTINKDDF